MSPAVSLVWISKANLTTCEITLRSRLKQHLLFLLFNNKTGKHLFYVSGALGVFRSNGETKGACYREGPPRDSKDTTVPKKAR